MRRRTGLSRPQTWRIASRSTRQASRRSWKPSSARMSSCGASSVRAAASVSGAIRRSFAAFAAPRWQCCGARSSPRSSPPSGGSSRRGRGSAGGRRCGRLSFRSRDWHCRSASGRATCCRGGSPDTGRPTSMPCARRARSCGRAPGSIASRRTSARILLCSGSRRPRRCQRVPFMRRFAQRSAGERSSGRTCSRPASSTARRRSLRCGTSCGPAR